MTPISEYKRHNWPNIRTLVDLRARETPDAVYLIDPESGLKTTYRDLKEQVVSVAKYINLHGIKQGETVAFAMSNETRTAVILLGIMYGGFVATAINLVAGKDVITYVLEHSETKLVLTNDKGNKVISDAIIGSQIDIIVKDAASIILTGSDVENKDKTEEENFDGLLMYTSGTTGRPKGVLLTHQNLIAGGLNTANAHQLSAHDRGICVLPLYHINGLCVTVMGSLVAGGSLVIPRKFSVSNFWSVLVDFRANWFSVVPTQISYLLHSDINLPESDDLASVRFGRSASAPLSPEIQEAFEAKFSIPIIETMGLTETAAQILSNPLPPGRRKIGSPGVGYGNEIRIMASNQNDAAVGEEGELLVRGPNVMRCYLKNEEATEQAFTEDGFLKTGDLGKFDEDGYVYITGRLKELIIKGGENIAPREIDEALYSHPDVIEAAAFSQKCDQYGERVEAAVMLAKGSELSEGSLKALCIEKVGAFKSPDRIYLLPELPKGPSGKIQRLKLQELIG